MQTSRDHQPASVADVLALLQRDPGRPRITWYGDDGERVELSGAVLVNWVTKTTNLLVEELDAGPGVPVLLDLPPHWRSLVWSLAVWRSGAGLLLADENGTAAPGPVVTARPLAHPGVVDLVAVALPALARTHPDPLPPGALDAAASVMTYGDVLGAVPPTDPAAAALAGDDALGTVTVPHRDLLGAARGRLLDALPSPVPAGPTARVLVPAVAPLRHVLLTALAVWAQDGSVVLASPDVLADGARTSRIVADERVTVRPG